MKIGKIIILFFSLASCLFSYASSGKAGQNVRWNLDDKGTLVFSGNGEMKNFGETPYNPSLVKTVLIEEGVTNVGANAFKNCNNLVYATIPSTCREIGSKAFADCKALKDINLSYGLMAIGNEAFMNCEALNEVIIPQSVRTIGYRAFSGCKFLTRISIPSSVTSMGYNVFQNCNFIEKILHLPDFVTSLSASDYKLPRKLVEQYWERKPDENSSEEELMASNQDKEIKSQT